MPKPLTERGAVNTCQWMMRFVLWAQQLKQPLSWQRIAVHFGVSRATAYRYLQAWREANGLPPPSRPDRVAAPSKLEVKDAVGYRAARDGNPARCLNCDHLRPTKSVSWWHCKRHGFFVRASGTCNQFTNKETP